MFDTTFVSKIFQEKAVFELKFPVDCETCIVDVQTNKMFKKFLECSGTSFGLRRNGFVKDAKVPFYGHVGVIWQKKFERGSVLCINFFLTLSERFHKCSKSRIESIKMNTPEKIFWLCEEEFWILSRKFWAGLSKLLSNCLTKPFSE